MFCTKLLLLTKLKQLYLIDYQLKIVYPTLLLFFIQLNSCFVLGEDDLELLSLPPALKEKYIRLQTENRMLNKKLKDTENNTATESLLEDAQSRVNELESDARYVNRGKKNRRSFYIA